MINHRISADWVTTKHSLTTKPIAAFSCTPRVQEVHTKAEYLTPGLLGLGVLFKAAKHMINPSQITPYPWNPRLTGIIQLSRIGNVLRNI